MRTTGEREGSQWHGVRARVMSALILQSLSELLALVRYSLVRARVSLLL